MRIKAEKSFSCAHFYRQALWPDERNREEFGKCFTEFGHGHDYTLEIEFSSSSQSDVLKILNDVIESLDHQHLNFVIAEFQTKIPTTENLALYLRDELFKSFLKSGISARIHQLRLQENPEIWVEL